MTTKIKTITKWAGAKTADGESAFDAEVNAALAAGWRFAGMHTSTGVADDGPGHIAQVEVYLTAVLAHESDIVSAE